MLARYDRIGVNYAQLRRPDPRIAAAINEALGKAETVLNVGAGTGSYEPADRQVTAVEPSLRDDPEARPGGGQGVQARADDLPFDDDEFDAAMAILTIHHWPDKAAGLREMRRVTRGRIVLLTFDPAHRPWLTDYLPELAALDEAQMPAMADYERWLGPGAGHAGAGAARLQRRLPLCLLAPARGLSRCAASAPAARPSGRIGDSRSRIGSI